MSGGPEHAWGEAGGTDVVALRPCLRCGAVLRVREGAPPRVLLPAWLGGAEVDSSVCVLPRLPPPRWFVAWAPGAPARPPG